jgi:hypothetical protein
MKKFSYPQKRVSLRERYGGAEIYREAEDYYFSQMLFSEGNLRRANGLGMLENIDDILETCCR